MGIGYVKYAYDTPQSDGVSIQRGAVDDVAGSQAFDGRYVYHYDAWNRLIQVNAATIATYLPFPAANIAGELAKVALGEQTMEEAMVAIGIGLIPGGKLLGVAGKLLGKAGAIVGKLASAAWSTAKYYAGRFFSGLARAGGALVDGAMSLAERALSWFQKGCGCFTENTLVWTERGQIPIRMIVVGDVVKARNEATGEDEWRRVVDTFTRPGAAIIELVIVKENGARSLIEGKHAPIALETIETTEEHPFLVDCSRWLRADQLSAGMSLTTTTGVQAKVVTVRFTDRRQRVYNFEVEGLHTYAVGGDGVVVHNMGCVPGPWTVHNYRDRFISALGSKVEEVHHRIPQVWSHLFPSRNIHDLSNLRGVSEEVHAEISRQWKGFRKLRPNATAMEVESFADAIDGMFGWALLRAD
ncbi:hypothetical protein LC605_32645 [Nostoc sp. CHAB 5836]|uniref:polymorphic toxin-type HINT domain-containing protein n=1 Tax=Nostoc sp. CHAB 5836 TaxID=2780404 RepID=UPI001E57E90E|nr:polymorphic toxin-type HINT domain-containing protein [Nostoc sp. CHAB 5836]MCC5619693.1 hypothetical protein [Nostoc sp. CHAB 5836]